MSFAEMKQYLDKCIYAYPNIKVLVFTGGECTLLWRDLIKMISYANSIGIRTRIVTNGWWAKSYKIAVNKIKELVKAGLKEINFSTGDDHQQWIPFKQVRNAAVAAIRHHLICAINVETKDNSLFNIDSIIAKDKVFKSFISCTDNADIQHIYIEKGIWASLNKGKETITYKQYENCFSYKRCKHLFSTIAINPYGEVLACCGITSESNPYMRLGNINKENIGKIYERSFDDILKLWLYIDGPEKIELYINKHKKKGKKNIFKHSCVTCKNIFCNPENLLFLRENVDEYFTTVMLRYNMLNFRNYEKEKNSNTLGTIGILSGSFLLQACETTNSIDELNQILTNNRNENNSLKGVPLHLAFSKTDQEYINFLQKLSVDIIKNPAIANEFASNPNKFFYKHGYKKQPNIDNSLIKYILALGNKNIITAIQKGDVNTYISECKKQGIINLKTLQKDPYLQKISDYFYKKENSSFQLKEFTRTKNANTDILNKTETFSAVYGFLAVVIAAVAVETAVVLGNDGLGNSCASIF